MKSTISVFLFVILTYLPVYSQNIIDSSKVVRVLSFNILHGATTKGDFDLEKISRVIEDANPDFVAMQEVDFKTNRVKKFDLATELGWRAKMAAIFGKAMKFDGGEYGEAILSDIPLYKAGILRCHILPEVSPELRSK